MAASVVSRVGYDTPAVSEATSNVAGGSPRLAPIPASLAAPFVRCERVVARAPGGGYSQE